MTSKPWFRPALVAVALVVFGFLQYQYNIIPIKASRESVVPLEVSLQSGDKLTSTTHVEQSTLPTSTPTSIPGSFVKVSWYPWTAVHGVAFANGGVRTTKDSLMERNNVKVQIVSQPDLEKSKADQVKFATKVKDGDTNPAEGTALVITMGDGAAQYIASIDKLLLKLGPDYKAEVIGSVGYSGNAISGEDSCMGSPDWVEDPTKAKGALIAGYLRDGDWNLCLAWMRNVGLKNNPDETTFDPDAINWLSTDDYIKAAEAYINGACEDRKVVHNGKISNEPKAHVCVGGVATWTPGDVNIAKQKGGLVKLLSTKENAFQMPAVVIGIHKWNMDHAKWVTSFLKASFEGGDQVRSYDAALNKAGKVAFEIYGDQTATYWVKYYKGVVERDRTNRPVPLGGSRTSNLADNLILFGMTEGAGGLEGSIWKSSYEGFGNLAKQQYPKLIPDFPKTAEATNLIFLQALAETSLALTSKADAPVYTDHGDITDKTGETNITINFETGKATLTSSGRQTLDSLYETLAVNRQYVELDGHTDNTGAAASNLTLSEARAEAAAQYLTEKAPTLFRGRLTTKGFGQEKPLVSNSTAEGKAQNRRVTIILGNK